PLLLALPPAPELLEDALAPPEPALREPLVDSEENRLLSLPPQPGPDVRSAIRLDARSPPMNQRPAIRPPLFMMSSSSSALKEFAAGAAYPTHPHDTRIFADV